MLSSIESDLNILPGEARHSKGEKGGILGGRKELQQETGVGGGGGQTVHLREDVPRDLQT